MARGKRQQENTFLDSQYKTRLDAEVYVVVNPITYGDPEMRREAGEEVSDLSPQSIPWLLEQEHIRLKEGN